MLKDGFRYQYGMRSLGPGVLAIAATVLSIAAFNGCGDDSAPDGRVPDVVGMTRKEASEAIIDAGLRWRGANSPIPTSHVASYSEDDLVLRQTPASGTALKSGGVVVIQTCVSDAQACARLTPDPSNGAPI